MTASVKPAGAAAARMGKPVPGGVPTWAPLALGMLLMYLPSFYDIFNGVWSTEEQAHGPIILGISLWLVYRNWPQMLAVSEGQRSSPLGWPLLVFSVLIYFIGRSQGILIFEIGSFLSTLSALILLTRGKRALRTQWFPLFFMLFMLPLPGSLVDALTLPMKTAVSIVVDKLLHMAGYPISRTGVILQIGQYQLLVADACAGLHTLFTLEALGLLYLNVVRHNSLFRNVTLAILIVPISFISNVIRVIVLTLITYHMGDAAGQGFLHGFAGMVLFVSALLLIIATDSLLRVGAGDQALPLFVRDGAAPAIDGRRAFGPLARTTVAGLIMAGALGAALAVKPQKLLADATPQIMLEQAVPVAFGSWKLDPQVGALVPSTVQQEAIRQIYSQTLSRTYVNERGERIMLSIAYGSNQTQQLRAHRQEVCYTAQGFQVDDLRSDTLSIAGQQVSVTRMVASNGPRIEPVTYWFTMGSRVVRSYLDRQITQLRYALSDFIPDGYLFRVSSIQPDVEAAYRSQEAFTTELMNAMDPALRAKLLGGPP